MEKLEYCFDKHNCSNREKLNKEKLNKEKTCFHIFDSDSENEKNNYINKDFINKDPKNNKDKANWCLIYGPNGSGKTILANALGECEIKKKEIYKNLKIKVFNEKFINDFCYIYDEKTEENKNTSKNQKELAKFLMIETEKIQKISKEILKFNWFKNEMKELNNFFLKEIQEKLISPELNENKNQIIYQNIDEENIKKLEKGNENDFNNFLKKFEKEFNSKNIEIIFETIRNELKEKKINNKDKEKINDFLYQNNKEQILKTSKEVEKKWDEFTNNIDENNKINEKISKLKEIWKDIKNEININLNVELKNDFKNEFIDWQIKGRHIHKKYEDQYQEKEKEKEKEKKSCCLFCFKENYTENYTENSGIKKLLENKNIGLKEMIKEELKISKKAVQTTLDVLKKLNENDKRATEKNEVIEKIDNCLKNIKQEKIIEEKKIIEDTSKKIKELIDLIKKNEKAKEVKKFSDKNLNFIKEWKEVAKKYNIKSFFEEKWNEYKGKLETENTNLKKELDEEIENLEEIWKFKEKIKYEITKHNEAVKIKINGFNYYSSGERKALAIILFFVTLKQEIIKEPDTNFIVVFDDILDQLDFGANFKIHNLLLNRIGQNEKIKLQIFLTHQLEFVNFFIYIKRCLLKYFHFFVFIKIIYDQKNENKKNKLFFLKLNFFEIFQTDFLIFKKYLERIKIGEETEKIDYFIFWALWRKVIEKILTAQINIKNGNRIEIENKNCLKQFKDHIDKKFPETELKTIKEIFKNILTKWHEAEIIEKTEEFEKEEKIIKKQINWKISSEIIKQMIKSTTVLLNKKKFLNNQKKNVSKEKCYEVKNFIINDREIENKIIKIKEKLFESMKNKNFVNIEEDYQQLFLINFTYFLLANIKTNVIKVKGIDDLKWVPNNKSKCSKWVEKSEQTDQFKKNEEENKDREESWKYTFFRHANNNLFPDLFAYDKELFEVLKNIAISLKKK